MIKLIEITKRYGALAAVDSLSLEVPQGEVFGFLGPNGAGKTTTIRMMMGILRPSSGRVFLGGHDVEQEPQKAKALAGFIPDRPFIYEKLTGYEFLQFVGKRYLGITSLDLTRLSAPDVPACRLLPILCPGHTPGDCAA